MSLRPMKPLMGKKKERNVDLDMMMKVQEVMKSGPYLKPDVISTKKIFDELHVDIDWKVEKTSVIIKKISENSFSYEDPGNFLRKFPTIKRLLWEYELPISLKEDIESLPISHIEDKEYMEMEKFTESKSFEHNSNMVKLLEMLEEAGISLEMFKKELEGNK